MLSELSISKWLKAEKVVVFTGAGISAESGIPTFRDQGGLWDQYRPEELANEEAFRSRPDFVWQWYQWRRSLIRQAEPNEAHIALVEMEHMKPEFTLISQNVDGFHKLAGSQKLLELHGNIQLDKCIDCQQPYEQSTEGLEEPPLCRECGGLIRPGVVWFGENLSPKVMALSAQAVSNCDFFITIGTSAIVQPAASLIYMAKQNGAYIIEINPNISAAEDIVDDFIRDTATVGTSYLLELLEDNSLDRHI